MKASQLSAAIMTIVAVTVWEPPLRAQDASVSLESLAWILGDWEHTEGKDTTGECWQRVSPSTWEGYGFAVRQGDTVRTEDLRLVQLGGAIFYVSKVQHNELPVAFRLAQSADSSCVFENVRHDFPQRILYSRSGNSLSARIEGETNGETRAVDYTFLKVSREE